MLWDFGPGHVFTVSVADDGTLTYAGLLGGGVKRHGVEPFNGDIPKINSAKDPQLPIEIAPGEEFTRFILSRNHFAAARAESSRMH